MPRSRSGRWAVGFGAALVVLTALSLIFAAAIGGDAAVIADSPSLTVLAFALSAMFTLAGPLSFFVGIFSIIKHKEWSVCMPLAAEYVLTLALFLSGELFFPH